MTASSPHPQRPSERAPLPSAARPSQRELFRRAIDRKETAARGRAVDVRSLKGMGPNKASGHKGGIGRQGSKRG